MLEKGSEIARQKAQQTLEEMKSAMKINYFDDKELVLEQSKKFSEI